MELFLNFVWALLFVPAYWLWRRKGSPLTSPRCLLTLGCALVLLFPVISATDDLHEASQVMEASGSSKWNLKLGHACKAQRHFTPAVLVHALLSGPLPRLACSCVLTPTVAFPEAHASRTTGQRAPPNLS